MPQTITDALTTCVVLSDTTRLIVNGDNSTEIIDVNVFNGNSSTCVEIKFLELEDNW